MHKTIDDFTDAELAKMVRDSVYVKGTMFDKDHARFLLVMAVPYGPEDTVQSLPEAIQAFASLMQEYDWQEREFQVYDHEASQHYFSARMEELEEA